MNPSPTLSTTPFEHPAMDYAFLRAEGIRQLERMSGQRWTDFNTHDPGITILEQFCYVLTDLANRIDYPLPDLLTSAGVDAYDNFYSPAQILTSQPVTLNDLRKLVIDVKGVKNAWVEKVAEPSPPLYFYAGAENTLHLQGGEVGTELVLLQGLYRVLVEIDDLFYRDANAKQGEVQRAVARRLHAHRNVGEDFEKIEVLDPQWVTVDAHIEIGPVDDAEEVLLAIYQRLADYVSPSIRFYALRQLLEAGKRVDEIFDGPLLEHGFIDVEELKQAQRRTTLYTSDMIRAIMAVPDVRAVKTIRIAADGAWQDWSLKLDPNKAPKLKLGSSNLRLTRNGLTASINVQKVIDAYYEHLAHADDVNNLALDQRVLQPPPGRDRNVEHYYSLQHQFPATYGIGATGLADSASPQRQAQAKQLKAYLLFFDQILANSFAQLAHLGDLFSFSANSAETYFTQPITDPTLGIEDILQADPSTPPAEPDFRRRNRFLNHLLARFAEQFTDYSLMLPEVMSTAGRSAAEQLVQDKQAFLQEYPQLSSTRGAAFNYLLPWHPDNRSGLEKRLRRKLGAATTEEDFYLVEHILLRPIAGDTQQRMPILVNFPGKDPYSLQVSFVFPNWPARYNKDVSVKAFVERTVREETPTHLALQIHWLNQEEMKAFKTAYLDWLDKLRSYWIEKWRV